MIAFHWSTAAGSSAAVSSKVVELTSITASRPSTSTLASAPGTA